MTIGGRTVRTACGRMTKRRVWKYDRPMVVAASFCVAGTDWMPAAEDLRKVGRVVQGQSGDASGNGVHREAEERQNVEDVIDLYQAGRGANHFHIGREGNPDPPVTGQAAKGDKQSQNKSQREDHDGQEDRQLRTLQQGRQEGDEVLEGKGWHCGLRCRTSVAREPSPALVAQPCKTSSCRFAHAINPAFGTCHVRDVEIRQTNPCFRNGSSRCGER